MSLKTKLVSKLVAGAFAATLAAPASAVVIIDLFTTNQAQLTDTAPGGAGLSSSVSGAGIIGVERDLNVNLLTQDAFNPNAAARIGVAGGALSFSVDSLATGSGIVQYDGVDGTIGLNPTGLGGANLEIDGGNAFALTTIFSDLGYEFVIEAYTDADTFTKISFDASAVVSPTTTFIPFAAFENPALCGAINPAPGVNSIVCGTDGNVDFSNVGALQVLIDPSGGTVSVDLTIDQVVVVPEPGSLALLAGGLLAGGVVFRRRRRSA